MQIQSKMCSHLQPCLFLQKLHFLVQGKREREGPARSCTPSIWNTLFRQLFHFLLWAPFLFLQKLHFLFQGRCEREGLPDSTSKSCTQSIGIPNYFQNNDTVQLPTRVQFNCNHKDIVQRNQLTITFHQKAPSQENVTSWNRLDGVIFTPLYLGKIVIQIQYFCKITT